MVVGASGLRTNQHLFFFQRWGLALEFALTTVFNNKHMTKASKPESFKMKVSGLVISSVQVWCGVLPILVLPVSLWIPRGQRSDSKPLDWKREGHELDWMRLWQALVHGALHELLIFLNFTTPYKGGGWSSFQFSITWSTMPVSILLGGDTLY